MHPDLLTLAGSKYALKKWSGAGGTVFIEVKAQTLRVRIRLLACMQELQILGRGGYGVVVAAINRLDGRKYAVKRIRLDAQLPASYARIMREVSTLSRLFSPHVVRYFQVSALLLCLPCVRQAY